MSSTPLDPRALAAQSTPAAVGTRRLRVLCVDDHAFLIEGLRARFALEPDLLLAGHRHSAVGLVDAVKDAQADIVLLDIEMEGPDPFEAIEDLGRTMPDVRVILLSAYVRDSYIDSAVKAGAWGYLSKRDEPGAIIDAIRRAGRGEFAFSDEVLQRCGLEPGFVGSINSHKPNSRLGLLTPRELQILRMIGRGLPRNEIAKAIHRSPKTVDAHRASIMDKLGLHDRVELARFAIREGLVEL